MGVLHIAPEVAQALEQKAPIVALESALITHGFAPPANLDIARQMEAAVRTTDAIPATIAILDGEARIGLSDEELEQLAADRSARKVSLRDLPILLAQGGSVVANGGTTVAATMHLAHRAGIRVFCTGGIGGVHRGHPEDASADLTALATTPIVTVCAGAKAILDLPRTLEVLETHGVPVIGYATDEFPAFYSRRSGLKVDTRVETPEQVAQIAQTRTMLGLSAALLVCVPVPEADQLSAEEAETAIAQAVAEAEEKGVGGKAVTPFLLARMVELTGGRARQANEALLLNNARTAARIARALVQSGVNGPQVEAA
ncbi:MAG: pseudouridine-5'-phosphate glycosidase [Anaerolineae bacterium]